VFTVHYYIHTYFLLTEIIKGQHNYGRHDDGDWRHNGGDERHDDEQQGDRQHGDGDKWHDDVAKRR
jgi:hypothetical protein